MIKTDLFEVHRDTLSSYISFRDKYLVEKKKKREREEKIRLTYFFSRQIVPLDRYPDLWWADYIAS